MLDVFRQVKIFNRKKKYLHVHLLKISKAGTLTNLSRKLHRFVIAKRVDLCKMCWNYVNVSSVINEYNLHKYIRSMYLAG